MSEDISLDLVGIKTMSGMNSSMMFLSVFMAEEDCRVMKRNLRIIFWWWFSLHIFISMIAGIFFFYLQWCGKEPVSHLVGSFFVTLDRFRNLFRMPFPIHMSSTSPFVCNATAFFLCIYLLWSYLCQMMVGNGELYFTKVEWWMQNKLSWMSVTFICTYIKPVKGHWNKPGSSAVKEAKPAKSVLEAAPDSSLTRMKNIYLFSTWMFLQWGNNVLNVCVTFFCSTTQDLNALYWKLWWQALRCLRCFLLWVELKPLRWF